MWQSPEHVARLDRESGVVELQFTLVFAAVLSLIEPSDHINELCGVIFQPIWSYRKARQIAASAINGESTLTRRA